MAGESPPLISKLRKITRGDISAQQENNKPLKRFGEKAKKTTDPERCDFCSKPIPPDHKHFADLNEMKFMCACEMCAVLQAEKGEYRQIPERYQYLENFDMPERIWLELKIPVNMAFIVYNSKHQKHIAFYPSPAGATESELNLGSWNLLKQKNQALEELEPDIEGFMINRLDKPAEYYIVPIDCCYKLIGLIRLKWQGMHGGKEMRSSVRGFFKNLKKKAS
jgi:hypothetical protein